MKKYTMNDFITGKLAVRVNKDNIMDFLKMCEEKGLVWHSGNKAIEGGDAAAKCIACGFHSDNKLSFSLLENSPAYFSEGYTFVDFSQIIKPIRYQIIIESDGDTTTAKMFVNGKEVKTTTAKRNPADKANWRTGAQTAFDRLWQKQPKPEKPAENGGFKIGDRVVYAGEYIRFKGKSGRIVDITEGFFGVEFDENIYNHSCAGKAKSGHGLWCNDSVLIHEQPTKQAVKEVERHAKVGEWVKIVNKRGWGSERYKHGEILQVTGLTAMGNAVLSCGGAPAFDDEYVVLEGYQPGRDA